MPPDDKAETSDAGDGVDHGAIAEERPYANVAMKQYAN